MEMILGALGRDALGLGSSIAHPKESEEWKRMTVREERGLTYFLLIYIFQPLYIPDQQIKDTYV